MSRNSRRRADIAMPANGTSVRQLRRKINAGQPLRTITRIAKLRHRRGLRGHETPGFAN